MQIIENFKKFGQEHVFKFYNELNPQEQSDLISQTESINLEELAKLSATLTNSQAPACDFSKLEPADYIPHPENGGDSQAWAKARQIGINAIKNGELACFVVAGGQGTRLGFDAPKGTYKISVVENKSLFQIFAEKILRANLKYNTEIPFLVMTSHINNEATVKFFEENHFFGLKKENVIFFKQGLMPSVNAQGKILMEAKSKISMTPNGHGGSLKAIVDSKTAQILKERGIKYLSYFQVDNPLINIVDEVFVGQHIQAKSQMSSKMIAKNYPLEKVGHFCTLDGKLQVVEYSDLPTQYQELRDESGKLKFLSGSIAIHIIDLSFIEECATNTSMPYHIAHKKIPFIDESGVLQKPEEANGFKFELFIFDALTLADNTIVVETLRREEFSPVKNATGIDSPLTCKNDQLKQFAHWLSTKNINIELDADGVPTKPFEISPLYAANLEDFKETFTLQGQKPLT